MLKELLWVSYPYERSQGEKWICFPWFTEQGGGQMLGSTLHRQSSRAWKPHTDLPHRPVGPELPSLNRRFLSLHPKGSKNAPETRFLLCTAVNAKNNSAVRIFSPKMLTMGITSRLFNSMGKIPLSSVFLGMKNFTDAAEVVLRQCPQETRGALRPQEMFQSSSLLPQLSPVSNKPKSYPAELLSFSLAGTVTHLVKSHKITNYLNYTTKDQGEAQGLVGLQCPGKGCRPSDRAVVVWCPLPRQWSFPWSWLAAGYVWGVGEVVSPALQIHEYRCFVSLWKILLVIFFDRE